MGSVTDHKPKCLVEYRGKTLIKRTLDLASAYQFEKIILVGGYKFDLLKSYVLGLGLDESKLIFIENRDYQNTNMVESLFCAETEFNSDIVVSYSDISYGREALDQLVTFNKEIAVVVDKSWMDLWSLRMENPLEDAETLKINSKGCITELGLKPKEVGEIQGQYIGLFSFPIEQLNRIREVYHSLDRDHCYQGRQFKQMFMTTFLQILIDRGFDLHARWIEGGWLEIDTESDLISYQRVPPVD